MSTAFSPEALKRRVMELSSTDSEFAAARPDEALTEAISKPGLRLAEVVSAVMGGYANRPALAQRPVECVQRSDTEGALAHIAPRFETVSYGQLWARAQALASAMAADEVVPVRPGDRVCIVGFTGIDYATVELALVRLGAMSVPLQTGAPVDQLTPIIIDTEPRVIATSAEYLAIATELALRSDTTARLLVFDHNPALIVHAEALQAAQRRRSATGDQLVIETMAEAIERGRTLPCPAVALDEDNPVALLIYTSGSTGEPKGAMYTERHVLKHWLSAVSVGGDGMVAPSITYNFLPMSHAMGRSFLFGTLANGGTAYFAAKSDLSTFFDDLALVRPTTLAFVPRIWDMVFERFRREVNRRCPDGTNRATVESEVMAEQRQRVLGGRFVSCVSGSAPMSTEMWQFVESLLALHVMEVYASTESGGVLVDGKVRRPPIIDYKLDDVSELGYFRTDRPHPRGELLIKSEDLFAGYYKRPEVTAAVYDEDGYYRTGDIMAETGPDELVYLDRRNNVLKLSQGEFVAISRLEAVFGDSALIRQIYVYGNSARPYLLAVVVPTEAALSEYSNVELKALVHDELRTTAKATSLQSYEIPRDFIIEAEPFTLENNLLTGLRKLAWPKLKERYGARLEQLYADLAQGQVDDLHALRATAADAPTLSTVKRAAGALLGASSNDLPSDTGFTDLGGDSLSAVGFADLLQEIFGVEVPVSMIVNPATNLSGLADYVEAESSRSSTRPTIATVHGGRVSEGPTEVYARELTLDKFFDQTFLDDAGRLPRARTEVRTVLLTGATGFLGRFLVLELLRGLSKAGGTLVCLVRARDNAAARGRLEETFNGTDPQLLADFRALADDHLQVLAGDKSDPKLGLDEPTWEQLAEGVDLIVDPAALVNHVLPYHHLFGPNVAGTVELIRLALTSRLKLFSYVSTVGVGTQTEPSKFVEDADIREMIPARTVDDSYANGYSTSKWASEVLLREAHDLCSLPIAVFRCDMLLLDRTYTGQLNLPDMFTRLMLSVVATGIAPYSWYDLDTDGNRQRAHYDGLPVDFVAEAIATLSPRAGNEFETYHVMNPHDDGIGLDMFIDWLIDAGYPIHRIGDYGQWLHRFETAMRALPERQRNQSLLPLLDAYRRPSAPSNGSIAPAGRFRAAVQRAEVGSVADIPHIDPALIVKYIANLELLEIL